MNILLSIMLSGILALANVGASMSCVYFCGFMVDQYPHLETFFEICYECIRI